MIYTIIDNASGFIWAQTQATNPIDACHGMDQDIAPGVPREYEEVTDMASNESGYHVYLTPESFVVEDGQCRESIEQALRFERVAIVKVNDAEE